MRIVAIAVIISMCHVPAAFAAETLRDAAVRAADRLMAAEAAAARTPPQAVTIAKMSSVAVSRPFQDRHKKPSKPRAAFQQTPRGLEGAGMGARMKVLLGVGIAAALTGIMLSIDGEVEDNTPSTKGERTNEPF